MRRQIDPTVVPAPTETVRCLTMARPARRCALAIVIAASSACGQRAEQRSPLATQRATQALAISDFVIGTDTPELVQYEAGWYPGVAASGSNRMVVFEDTGRTQAVLFDQDGPIGLDWIDLGLDEVAQYYPSVAFGEDRYLVAWYESGSGVYGQVLSVDGALLSDRKLLADAAVEVQVDWLAGAFVVAWNDGTLHIARVDLDAEVIDGTQVDLTDAPASRPVLATLDDQGLVAFSQLVDDERSVQVARFDHTGALLDATSVVVNPNINGTPEVAVAAGNAEYLVAFRGADDVGILASVVSESGELLAAEQPVADSASIGGHTVGFDGEQFVVVWSDGAVSGGGLVASNVSTTGEVAPIEITVAGPPAGAASVNYLDLVYAEDGYSIVYRSDGIRGQYFDADLARVGDALPLSAFPGAQNLPTPVWDGQNYVLTWSDEREFGTYQMRGTRISPEGMVLDPDGLAISQSGAAVGNFGVGSSGQVTAFAWTVSDDESAYLRTMNTEAELSATQLLATGRPRAINVLGGADGFLVLYTIGADANSVSDSVMAQPLDSAGMPRGSAVPVVSGVPGVAASFFALDGEYWVTYDNGEVGALVRLSAAGEVIAELELPEASSRYYNVAAGGDAKLFLWQDDAGQALARVLDGETWGEPFSLTEQVVSGAPAAQFDGTRFVTVWVEERLSLWTRNVELDGTLGEESQLLEGDYSFPRITASGGETMLLSMVHWEKFARTRRIESRLIAADGVVIEPPSSGDEPRSDESSTSDDMAAVDDAASNPDADDVPPNGSDDSPDDPAPDDPAPDDPVSDDASDDSTETDDGPTADDGPTESDDTSVDDSATDPDDGSATDDDASDDADPGASGDSDAGSDDSDVAASSGSDSGCDCAVIAPAGARDSRLSWALLLGLAALRRRARSRA